MRYRFKGIVRTTGQTVEGHAHGDTPDGALQALSEHGIVTESLREDPEPLNLGGQSQPLSSAIDSALDTAASQVPFEAVANRYKGKNVWVLDRDKIRKRVAQVVDGALRDAIGDQAQLGSLNPDDIRKQVSEAIGGLFKDNRNLTSQVSDNAMKMDHQIQRIETVVRRAESVLAQMTVAIGRLGSGGFSGGGGAGPRRYASGTGERQEQNTVLLEIFKENLRLRGIEIDENASGGTPGETPPAGDNVPAIEVPPQMSEQSASDSSAMDSSADGDKPRRPEFPPGASGPANTNDNEVELEPARGPTDPS